MAKQQVKTSREHIQSLAKATPLQALEELIWNGLDAGGPMVEVRLIRNNLNALQTVEVVDLGDGIALADLEQAFGEIGNSNKAKKKTNGDGRFLHGREGRGRLKALSICQQPEWITTYRKNGKLHRYSIRINRDDPDFFDPQPEEILKTGKTGTMVRLEYVDQSCDALLKEGVAETLARKFALYLSEYPGTSISFEGQLLRVDNLIDVKKEYSLPVKKGQKPASVTIIEWKFKLDSRKLYLCNESGFSFHDIPFKIPAPGIDFTAYLRTPAVKEWADSGLLSTAEFDRSVQEIIDLAKIQVRDHIRDKLASQAKDVVAEWKQQQVYPYEEQESRHPLVAAEQQVFDIVAVHIDAFHPTFRTTDLDNKRLTLTLVRKALESNPSALTSLLQGFTELTAESQEELVDLLERTTLSSLIKAGSIVTQRLDTVHAFEHILFSEDWKQRLLERTQLHRLLAHELWILGEEYLLATDDEGLREVLKKHVEILGRTDLAPQVDVRLINDKAGIPDLMLWHRRKVDKSLFKHLVVELKRPRDPLGQKEIEQIKTYAYTVIADERFKTDKVVWTFVLIGNDLDDYAKIEVQNTNLPDGCIKQLDNVSVWVLRWADVLSDARERYEFFRDKLDVQASAEQGMTYFKQKYEHLMTGRGVRKKKDLEASAKNKAPPNDDKEQKLS